MKVAGRWEAECLEIAALGMRIRCQGLLAVGSQIEAAIEAEGRVIPFKAEVVWRHAPDFTREFPGDMGLVIREPPQAYLDLVARLFAAE